MSSTERLAEASVWIAKLHGGTRGSEIEAQLRRWLQANPENGRAFELATEVWEESERLRSVAPFQPLSQVERRPRWRVPAIVFACVLALVIVSVVWFQDAGVVATAVGEQRQVVLEDGTRVLLNTDTRIVVEYDARARRVRLSGGEAVFKVVKDSARPFVVTAGARKVQALGTCFIVRSEVGHLAITLVEGSVLVSPTLPGPAPPAEEFKLAPGQRLTFDAGSATRLDTPSIQQITAWRRRQVIVEGMPLRAAAAEMNRYSDIKLIVASPEAAALLVSGTFEVGDSADFASVVAQSHGLAVVERGNEIVLSGKPTR